MLYIFGLNCLLHQTTMDKNNIAKRWKELCGQNKWQGLLKPLDPDLQKYLIHVGSFGQATYDGFIMNPLSKFNGRCRFSKKNFLFRCGLVQGNPFKYKLVKYLYAVSSVAIGLYKESNWIGFVAVATDEGKKALGRRDILISWRGTLEIAEWCKDAEVLLVPAHEILGKASKMGSVHNGFLTVYTSTMEESKFNKTSAREQVITEISKQMERYKGEEMSITITGHSLGAAISIINGADIACNGHNKSINSQPNKTCPVSVINYGCPLLGDIHFKLAVESVKDLHVLRVRNFPDMIPRIPAIPGYFHLGKMLMVNNLLSPYLIQPVGEPPCWHNLEVAYLHPLAIQNGAKNLRSLALINKNTTALLPIFGIPAFWWRARNMGMVQQPDGSWKLQESTDDEEAPTVVESKM